MKQGIGRTTYMRASTKRYQLSTKTDQQTPTNETKEIPAFYKLYWHRNTNTNEGNISMLYAKILVFRLKENAELLWLWHTTTRLR